MPSRLSARSLRAQLALVGFLAVLVPVVVLLAVVFASETEVESDRDLEIGPGGPTLTADIENVESGVSPWVPLTAALLAVPAALTVWWWAGKATRPIHRITTTTERIQAGSLDQRIGLSGAPAEVQALADSFDRMLDRLSLASTTQQQLIEDVSHELRTPLAALANNAEVILADDRATIDDYRAATERIEALSGRLQSTIDGLLIDARARRTTTTQVDNDLMPILGRLVDEQRSLDPGLSIDVAGPERLLLGIDGPSVERAVRNLIRNAAAHSPPGGSIMVGVDVVGAVAALSVTDEGPGIDPADLGRVFDRYYRGDESIDGHGIGLALVKQVADAYGGVSVDSPLGPDGGTRFTMRFPLPSLEP
ncbi:MAG: ATP-binding protein [Acidimicrobiia bacterium]|nr:ATP-binding protein [Acidimicrobiia bacterium]